ncbi:ABC transporter permease [Alloiococcus sp. CFN-8]|uniref:ABC transporter permease n=1 Tax=Alloiococcus sp. CFN-8 TaxID=3416081 RepID=UPI003CEB0F2C
MHKIFYPRLAVENIKKNKRTYVPYILTGIGMVMMFYMIAGLSYSRKLASMAGGPQMQQILFLGMIVIGVFSAIFLFYTNSFLMKRRKKELGLYNILGMEKKHIGRIIFYETIIVYGLSVILGLILGAVFSKALELLLFRIVHFQVSYSYEIIPKAIVITAVLFSGIYFLFLLNSLRQIIVSKPIELLKGGQVGEREPKTKWILTLIGFVALAYGYYISITIKEPLQALIMFFVAVILVIIGTYLLFMTGSIVVLKLLRRNKKYYYKTNHFISVSGMLYRMKQNSAGLANICILSTAVLVMISSTISLYIGIEDVMRTRYPRNMVITSNDYSEEYIQGVEKAVNGVLDSFDEEAIDLLNYRSLSFSGIEKEGKIYLDRTALGEGIENVTTMIRTIYFIPLEDYNRLMGEDKSLEDGEILIHSNRTEYKEDTLTIEKYGTFKVKEVIKDSLGNGVTAMNMVSSYQVVVKEMEVIEELDSHQKELYGEFSSNPSYYYGFDLKADSEKQLDIYDAIKEELRFDFADSFVEASAYEKDSFYAVYGGLFFLGIFLGTIFILATVLIIYYKQVTEGYEDKDRFLILQKVGMTNDEVKKTISSQVLTVFFLPLITAGIHMVFAFPVVYKLLNLFNLNNLKLYILCTLVTFLVFSIFYGVVYVLTSRTYYRIVRE